MEEELAGMEGLEPEMGLDDDSELGDFESLEFSGESDDFGDMEGEGEFFPALLPILGKIAPLAISALSGLVKESGDDYGPDSGETGDELAATRVPGLSSLDDAVMSQLAAEAAEADSEADAQALTGASVAKAAAKAPAVVKKLIPTLVKATSRITRVLRKANPELVKVVPTIQKKSVATLARKAAKGKPIGKKTAIRVVAKHTKRVLSKPAVVKAAVRKTNTSRRKAISRAESFL